MKDIKERLMSGESAEAILKELSSQVANAEREIEREKQRKAAESAKLSKARRVFVDAVVLYLKELGVVKDTEDTAEAKDMLYNVLKESEDEFIMYGKMLDKIKTVSMKSTGTPAPMANSDIVLRDFLKKSLS